MKVSTKGRYAIRALTHLSGAYSNDGAKPVSIREICKREKISARYLENIFVKLRKSGIVKSLKGERGGFFLAKSPGEITIYDILYSVETGVAPSKCAVDIKACARAGKCGIRKIWVNLDKKVVEYLSQTSLEEAARLHLNG
ncbi:MAG TPA: Rrf2 family transcriptional regulator [bacterium]|mgnify:CR=1 FL=1|nr:Rrf2 family transcriptional regulator [bacterium]